MNALAALVAAFNLVAILDTLWEAPLAILGPVVLLLACAWLARK